MKKFITVSLSLLLLMGACQPVFGQVTTVTTLGAPVGIYSTEDGLLVADKKENVIYQIKDKTASVFCGKSGVFDIYGNALGYYYDGSRQNAYFNGPYGITSYLEGYAVTDTKNNAVRYISDEKVYTIVGDGTAGSENDRSLNAKFHGPTGITTDDKGNLYIADTQNNRIRKVDTKGNVTTYAGGHEGYADGSSSQAMFNQPTGVYWYEGALYVCDSGNHRIRKVENSIVTTIAGTAGYYTGTKIFAGGYKDGACAQAQFSNPTGIIVKDGVIYVADTGNSAVRKIENGKVSTLVKNTDPSQSVYPTSPTGLAFLGDMLYISDPFAGIVYALEDALVKEAALAEVTYSFEDVAKDDWYYDAVMYMRQKGFIMGTSDTTYSPAQNMTRAMFVAVMGRIYEAQGYEIPETVCEYDDVKADMYYTKYVQWAKVNEIACGAEDNKFYPDENIDRQQMVVMLYNLAQYMQKDTSADTSEKSIKDFVDYEEIADWAAPAVDWAVKKGIISGKDGNRYDPNGSATRAEVSQIFMKFCQEYVE